MENLTNSVLVFRTGYSSVDQGQLILLFGPKWPKLVRFWIRKAQKVGYSSPSHIFSTQPVRSILPFQYVFSKNFALCFLHFKTSSLNFFLDVVCLFRSFSFCYVLEVFKNVLMIYRYIRAHRIPKNILVRL